MGCLNWFPQKVFADHFITDSNQIIATRSVLTPGIIYHINYGGRGAGKTYQWADALVVEASLSKIRVLVTREFQNSIDESIKNEIEDCIKARGLEFFFKITENKIVGLNGSEFIFKGIKNNIKSIKSISNVDIVLCEESENISKKSWDILLPSIRPKNRPHPAIIVLFNPDNELDDTYQRFIALTPDRSIVKKVNWRDNKYFPDHLNEQRLHALKTLPKSEYDNIWEGVPKGTGDDAIIQLDWIKAARFASNDPRWKKTGRRIVGYDPAGQGRDYNCAVYRDGNMFTSVDEWLKSPDLREASKRAFSLAKQAQAFIYDECGGYGDGVDIFVKDAKKELLAEYKSENMIHEEQVLRKLKIHGFNAGNAVYRPDAKIIGTKKTNGEMYTNLKAQTWGLFSQQLYNTFRLIELNESDIDPKDIISIDIDDNNVFNKAAKELSTPIWVKSLTNSKKKVEDKDHMEKRTGQPSPNIAEAMVMTSTPKLPVSVGSIL